ncbi:MAG: hypothetical protein JSW07_11605, partial [bacterium]
LILLTISSFAEVITHTVIFNKSDLKFSKLNNYDVVTIKGLEVNYEVGSPQLPFYHVNLIIAENEKIDHVEIIETKIELLQGNYDILPVQKPEILSSALLGRKQIGLTKPNPMVYSSDDYYPKNLVESLGNSRLSNLNIASIRVYPLQYNPIKGKIKFYSKITFQITTHPEDEQSTTKPNLSNVQSQILKSLVKNLMVEPDRRRLTKQMDQNLKYESFSEEYQYVIITNSSLENNFRSLYEWKHKKGVPSKIVTLDWIYINFQGIDDQEKIRNFIRHAYENWGTIWILLGGDTNIVPHRTTFAMDCEFGADPRENEIPCDLYYADLDGTWNDDGDDIYGEISDNVNLYPELFVGRAPVEDAAEADIFVNKIISYEKNPPLGYQQD